MADIPDTIVLKRDRDLAKRSKELWVRRTLLLALTVFLILAFLNVFGQRSTTSSTTASAATLAIHSPDTLRSGLVFETRVRIFATREIKDAIVVLSPEWIEGITFNTVEPSPVGEASRDGKLTLDYGHLGAGHKLVVYLQFQVNPTNVGRRSQDVALYDDTSLLTTANRTVTVFP